MFYSGAEKVLYNLWKLYGSIIEKTWKIKGEFSNEELIEEFFFIVLGGFGISYELNLSALKIIKNKGLLNNKLYSDNKQLTYTAKLLKNEFIQKQFEPMTKSKEFRKYRFINSKPIVVANAGYWLWNECFWNLDKKLKSSEYNSRKWLCECPGFGLKSASWFLRNIGYSDNYAVLDVHVLRFASRIGIEIPKTLSEKSYLHIEDILRKLCNKIGVTLGKMDFLIWTLGRYGYLDYVRCE